jgi:hypothetical protein
MRPAASSRSLSRREEDAERDGQVERRSFLARVGRCEVDRYASRRDLESRIG